MKGLSSTTEATNSFKHRIESIEDLALQLVEQNEIESQKFSRKESMETLKDNDLIGKMCHSRTRSKIISIISNKGIIAEYNIDCFQKNEVIFYKNPPKIIDDDDVIEEEDLNNNNFDEEINNNKLNKKINKNIFNKNFIFPLDYENIYNAINEFYYQIKNTNEIKKVNNKDFLNKIENYLNNNFYDIIDINYNINNKNNDNLEDFNTFKNFIHEIKYKEKILLEFLLFFLQNNNKTFFIFCQNINNETLLLVFNEVFLCFKKIYEIFIYLIQYNFSLNKNQNKNINFENLCLNYVKEYFTNSFILSNENIIIKLYENNEYLEKKLLNLSEIILNYLYNSVNNVNISTLTQDFIDYLNFFESIYLLFKDNSKISEEIIYDKLLFTIKLFKNQITENEIKIPYLPPINNKKYKYTLVVDLDETLVHYVEEEDKAYVQVRPFADYFLNELGKYFEIVIFTAAAEDYADIVLKELDKNNSVSYKLYRKHTNQSNGIFLKDLSKLGRDISKVCIIDNNKENFGLQPENGLHISSFVGDQNDNELNVLSKELMLIIKSDLNDIKPVIKKLQNRMNERYKKLGIQNE
jgi:Dullard-like phosphatase family protein